MIVVEQIRIVHFPDDANTRIALMPEDLERMATSRALVTDPATVASLAALIQRMPAAENEDAVPDCRWGASLCNRNGYALRSVYLDRFGRRAVIDGRPASVLATPVVRALARALRDLPRYRCR